MARTDHGTALTAPIRLPDSELVYHHSGLIEGTISYKLDSAYQSVLNAYLGAQHPDDPNVILYAARLRKGRAGLMSATFDCIGLSKDPSDRVVTFPNSINTEPIETHPRFLTKLAGVPDAQGTGWLTEGGTRRKSGAKFTMDAEGESLGFIGFTEADSPAELRGVRSYYRASIMCRTTYYTRRKPTMKEPCTIVTPDGDIPTIDGITKWLHLVTSAEQVGKANLWRVTEEYISGTNDQISTLIYGGV